MMGRACLGSIVLVVITAMAIIVLASINYAAGESNEDENYPIKMPFYHPNFLAYTSIESKVKNFEKEKRNPMYQDSTASETADSEREVEKTDSETSEALQLSSEGINFGELNEDENHPIKMPFNLPNFLTYTSTESTVKNFEKEKRNLTYQDSTTFETADSEREIEKTDTETSEVLQLPGEGINFDSVSAKIHHSEPDERDETVNKCSQPTKLSTQKSERELRRDIFRNYDKGARPVKRPLTPVKVNISIVPLNLISASEKQIVLNTYMSLIWMDDYLQWDPCEYGGITELSVPVSDVWRPDVGLTTAISDTSVFPVLLTPAIIYNCGKVHWFPQFTIQSKCISLYKNMLDSTMSCNFLLGSWTRDDRFLRIEGEYGEISTYCFGNDFNPDWELVSMFSSDHTYGDPKFSYINYKVTLKSRKNH